MDWEGWVSLIALGVMAGLWIFLPTRRKNAG